MDDKLNIHIEEINNGFLIYCYKYYTDKHKNAVYYPDIEGVIKHIDKTYGEIHRQLKKIQKKEEK